MDQNLHSLETEALHLLIEEDKQQAVTAIESGKIIYFPSYSFSLQPDEHALLSDAILHPKHKNISYDYNQQRLAGVVEDKSFNHLPPLLTAFMHRFAEFAKQIVDTLAPEYQEKIQWGRTSYRPAEILNRKSSKRKDDTRLHVDSFPATPVNGLRILRVFCNINPYGEPRVWHVGDPFTQVLAHFASHIPAYCRKRAKLLKLFKVTKSLRSPYDHYMLQLHDRMKLDDNYQNTVIKNRTAFPTQSTWLVFTDHVSHAALSGQFLLEQTFYLPVDAMKDPKLSPLRQWEKEKSQTLTLK